MEISSRVDTLVNEFKEIDSWEDKYKHIIQKGKALDNLGDSYKEDKFLVKGCQSKVWFHAEMKDGVVYFQGDSDAAIVRGVVALLLYVYSGSSPDEILATRPTFLEDIGLREHLSMSRSNGLSAMLKQISLYAIAFKTQM
ncbi:MAG: SufE family protein [Epsilonproteobacteria bacterium]|nr:MAG: SufE family protein [Campylobacterota bacterium]RLA68077.1 MAG: SufE family protein [Campylobacterota bacterium]